MKDGSRNSTWRLKKWNGSSPIRVATGGTGRQRQDDAAQHQRDDRRQQQPVDGPPPFAEGVRCSREIIGVLAKDAHWCAIVVAKRLMKMIDGSPRRSPLAESDRRRSGARPSQPVRPCDRLGRPCRRTALRPTPQAAALTPARGSASPPRISKLRILVERGAGRRQQHHRLGRARGGRIARGVSAPRRRASR